MTDLLQRLEFEGSYDERSQIEDRDRGYRSHVWAILQSGARHRITFYDVTRLSQTLDEDCASGRRFFTEPNLVIVPEVTLEVMEAAARTLASEGFFDADRGR